MGKGDRLRWMRFYIMIKIKHNKDLTTLSQKLRKNMTREEKQLWYQFLKSYPIQFKRQVTCGNYILDFYCSKSKLAVELNGGYHLAPQISKNDKLRTDYLNSIGITVLVFSNYEINHNFQTVCNQIDYAVKKAIEMECKE